MFRRRSSELSRLSTLYFRKAECQAKRMASLKEEIRQFCRHYALRLNTDLGQHFLVDEEALQTIVDAPDLKPKDTVVEIGPGIGVLTKELLSRSSMGLCRSRTVVRIRSWCSYRKILVFPRSRIPFGTWNFPGLNESCAQRVHR